MAITQFDQDMNIVQQLDDEPNDVGGLTAAELKAKFDEGGNAVKTYINGTLIPETEAEIDSKVAAAELASGNIPSGGTAGQALVKQSDADHDAGWGNVDAGNISGAVGIQNGGTGGSTAGEGLKNLISALSAITPDSTDKFTFLDVSGDVAGAVTLAGLLSALQDAGGPIIMKGSYVGTGTYGVENPTVLNFDFPPKAILFICFYGGTTLSWLQGLPSDRLSVITPEMDGSYTKILGYKVYINFSNGGKTVSFYCSDGSSYQNNSTYTYIYLALY